MSKIVAQSRCTHKVVAAPGVVLDGVHASADVWSDGVVFAGGWIDSPILDGEIISFRFTCTRHGRWWVLRDAAGVEVIDWVKGTREDIAVLAQNLASKAIREEVRRRWAANEKRGLPTSR